MIRTWINSLQMFAPRTIKATITSSLSVFYKASYTMAQHFYALFLIDVIWIFIFYDVIVAALRNDKMPPSLIMSTVLLVWSINWFVLTTSYLIAILQSQYSFSSTQYADKILRYAQLYLTIPLFILIGVLILSCFGIIQYPLPHWSITALMRIAACLSVFYWMDSSFSNLDILKSIEQAANFFLYNLPTLLLIFAIQLLLIALVLYPFSPSIPCTFKTIGYLFQNNYFYASLSHFHSTFPSILRTLLLRYGMLCIDYFIVSLIFCMYKKKKSDHYAASFFD